MKKKWNKSQTLTSRKSESSLSSKDRFSTDSLFKINVICDQSRELYDEYFSNKIPAIDLKTPTREQIRNILNLDGKTCLLESLPFQTDSSSLEINLYNKNRLNHIFNLYDIDLTDNYDEELILKCNYKNPLGINFHTTKDLLRIFVRIESDKTINILLIDPYHLVATTKYQELFNEHKNEYRFCYSRLKNLSILD